VTTLSRDTSPEAERVQIELAFEEALGH